MTDRMDARMRQDLDNYITGHYGEDQMDHVPQIDTVAEAVELMGGEQGLIDYINLKLSTEEVLDADEAVRLAQERDDPPPSDRLRLALDMLEQYHLCRTNLAIREAILRRLMQKVPLGTNVEARRLAQEARQELTDVEVTITELMGVDS